MAEARPNVRHRPQYPHAITPWAAAALSVQAREQLAQAKRDGIEVHVGSLAGKDGPWVGWAIDYRQSPPVKSKRHESRSADMAALLALREAEPLERIGRLSLGDDGKAWGFGDQ